MAAIADRLVWVDCEMTGLNPDRDELVEIAVIVTDFDLNPVDEGISIVIEASAEALDGMNDFVRDMHESSGLLQDIPNGVSLADAELRVLDYVNQHVPEEQRPPLAGNTIGTDRLFIARYMPSLDARLHYRSVDVSSIKELARRWFPRAYFNAPEKNGGHRALADIRESVRELAYYRRAVFQHEPGLSSTELSEISHAVVDEHRHEV
ncbi:MAG: oligoribonuclease [Agromyces sp.]